MNFWESLKGGFNPGFGMKKNTNGMAAGLTPITNSQKMGWLQGFAGATQIPQNAYNTDGGSLLAGLTSGINGFANGMMAKESQDAQLAKETQEKEQLQGMFGDNDIAQKFANIGDKELAYKAYKDEQDRILLEKSKLMDRQTNRPETTFEKERAKQKAAVLGELETFKSNIGHLEKTVDELNDLAGKGASSFERDLVNNTIGLFGYDTDANLATKEYEAKVNNILLPQLKATFGAAFTEKETEALKKTLGDPSGTPEEKKQALKAFISNKRAQIATKQNQLNMMSGKNDNYFSGKYGVN